MNTFLSLRAYRLLESFDNDDYSYRVTELGNEIFEQGNDADKVNNIFARHILTNLTGMSLLKAVESINSRGDKPKLDIIGYELQEMGYSLSPNAQSIVSLDIAHFGMDNQIINENQKFSNTTGIIKADVFTNAGYTISGDFNYGQQNRYFYGYNQYNIENNKESSFFSSDVRRQFQDFGGKISFFNHLPTVGKFDYRVDLVNHSFSDNLKNKENGIQAKLGLAYWLSEKNALSVELITDLTKYRFDKDTAQRLNQFFISPNYSFHSDNFLEV
jgi:hypothetical protein